MIITKISKQTMPVQIDLGSGNAIIFDAYCHRGTKTEKRELNAIQTRFDDAVEKQNERIETLQEKRSKLLEKASELEKKRDSIEDRLSAETALEEDEEKQLRAEFIAASEEFTKERKRIEKPVKDINRQIETIMEEGEDALHELLAEQLVYITASWDSTDEEGKAIPLSVETLCQYIPYHLLKKCSEEIAEALRGFLATRESSGSS